MPKSNVRVVVHSCLDRPFGDRWVTALDVVVLVGQRPWMGETCVELLTWCPRGWLSASDWTTLKGELERGAYVKKKEKKGGQSATRSATDEGFARDHPVLYDYLTTTCWDDDPKQPRQTSTLLIFAADGCWKCCLRDRAECCCCWCAAPTIGELLAVVERELGDGTAVWREDRLSGAAEAKRRPREKLV